MPRSAEADSVPSSAAMEVPRKDNHHYDNYKPPQISGSTSPDSGSKVMDSIVFLTNPPSEYETLQNKDVGGDKGKEAAPTHSIDISVRYETAYPTTW